MIFFQFILIGTCLNLCYKSVGCDNTILVSSATSLSGIVQQSKGAVTFKVVGTMLASISFFKGIMMSFEHNRLIFYINGLYYFHHSGHTEEYALLAFQLSRC